MKNWFKEYKWKIILSTALTLLPMLIGLVLWDQLPDIITSHWGADGVADGTAGKGFVVFGFPAIMAGVNLLCFLGTAIDPKQANQSKKAMGIIFWIMPLISLVVSCGMYAVAMGRTVDVYVVAPLMLGVLFVVIGNYMPKVKQNSSLGVKIPWTLCNEENWNKTHRFAGKVWVAGGVVLMLTALLPAKWLVFSLLGCVLLLAFAPMVYSFTVYKAHKTQGITYAVPPKTQKEKIASRVSMVLVIAILAGVAVVMFTGDITYTLGEERLQIKAGYSESIAVPYADLDEIELRENFDFGVRVLGFHSARLSTGTFQNEELADYTLYAYSGSHTVILIRSGEDWLAINAKTAEETKALYESLLTKIGK